MDTRIDTLRPNYEPARALDILLSNDRNYFRAGAQALRGDGWTVYCVPGYQHLAVGAIAEVDNPLQLNVLALARHMQDLGGHFVRFYVPGDLTIPSFARFQLRRTVERAMAAPVERFKTSVSAAGITIRPVRIEDDAVKAGLLSQDEQRPDGKDAHAADYAGIERIKLAASFMRGYLVYSQDRAIASFNLSWENGLVRLKNVYVVPAMRGQRLASVMMAYAHARAAATGATMVGSFAVADGPGQRAYQAAGLTVVGAQTEYFADLKSPGLA
ncbi:MAG TPA: hypothetical protein DCL54_13555 [Alphaproteobacteria bacterium]|nr:hypothetical protein [Alphaproteobacteria bacterium]HAJ47595.1 hypothetical protein [Alphaproteobacteria bacterium]